MSSDLRGDLSMSDGERPFVTVVALAAQDLHAPSRSPRLASSPAAASPADGRTHPAGRRRHLTEGKRGGENLDEENVHLGEAPSPENQSGDGNLASVAKPL